MTKTRNHLIEEVHTLLDLPLEGPKGRKTKARKIVNAIIQALEDKIKEGKPVQITGFGTFYTAHMAAKPMHNMIVWSDWTDKNKNHPDKIVLSPEPITIPPYKKVMFRPVGHTKAALNLDSLNSKLRRYTIERTSDGN